MLTTVIIMLPCLQECMDATRGFAASNNNQTNATVVADAFAQLCNAHAVLGSTSRCSPVQEAISKSFQGSLGKRAAGLCSSLLLCGTSLSSSCMVDVSPTTSSVLLLAAPLLDNCTATGLPGGSLAPGGVPTLTPLPAGKCTTASQCGDPAHFSCASNKQTACACSSDGQDTCVELAECSQTLEGGCSSCVASMLAFTQQFAAGKPAATINSTAVADLWAGFCKEHKHADAVCATIKAQISASPLGTVGKQAGGLCKLLGPCAPFNTTSSSVPINTQLLSGQQVRQSLDMCSMEGVSGGSRVPGVSASAALAAGGCVTTADCKSVGLECSMGNAVTIYTCNQGILSSVTQGTCVKTACQICRWELRFMGPQPLRASGATLRHAIIVCILNFRTWQIPSQKATGVRACGNSNCAAWHLHNMSFAKPCDMYRRDCMAATQPFATKQATASNASAVADEWLSYCQSNSLGANSKCSEVATSIRAGGAVPGNLGKRAAALCFALGSCNTGTCGGDLRLDRCTVQGLSPTSGGALVPGVAASDALPFGRCFHKDNCSAPADTCTPGTQKLSTCSDGVDACSPGLLGACSISQGGCSDCRLCLLDVQPFVQQVIAGTRQSSTWSTWCKASNATGPAASAANAARVCDAVQATFGTDTNSFRRAGKLCTTLQRCSQALAADTTCTLSNIPLVMGSGASLNNTRLDFCTAEGVTGGNTIPGVSPTKALPAGKCQNDMQCGSADLRCDMGNTTSFCYCGEGGSDLCLAVGDCRKTQCARCGRSLVGQLSSVLR